MKTILITGSTDGIGKLAAILLAREGHQILIHGRNEEKIQSVLSEIEAISPNDKVFGFLSDLADPVAIKKMVKEVSNQFEAIDVLINNAGVFKSQLSMTKDNLDIRFAVNYLAPVMLTKGILNLLHKTKAPRVVNLSSAAQASVVLDALCGEELLSEQEAYAQSKLALTMWSFDLAMAYPEITTIAVNPGSLLNTNMVEEAYGRFGSSADKGAEILYDLAVSEEHQGKSGQYFDNDQGRYAKAHPDAYDQSKIKELRLLTNNMLKLA